MSTKKTAKITESMPPLKDVQERIRYGVLATIMMTLFVAMIVGFIGIKIVGDAQIVVRALPVFMTVVTVFIVALTLFRFLQQDRKIPSYSQSLGEISASLKISDKDYEKLFKFFEGKFSENVANDMVMSIYRMAESKLEKFSESNIVNNVFSDIRERLAGEIGALQTRGNINLVLGISIAVLGIGLLGYYVWDLNHAKADLVYFFLPRLSLVILIEVFSYFFLKLYKESLNEIKFFQNELTNIESKLAAMHLSFVNKKDFETIGCVINELVKTDRNKLPRVSCSKGIAENDDHKSTIELIKTIADVLLKNDKKPS